MEKTRFFGCNQVRFVILKAPAEESNEPPLITLNSPSGGGFSMLCQSVSGRTRTWVLNIRDGALDSPEGAGNIGAIWTISEAARAVRAPEP